tara:strand:+ start:185 stop:448 length:264 start_codon:yes stop_codon:yes gene_type:complete
MCRFWDNRTLFDLNENLNRIFGTMKDLQIISVKDVCSLLNISVPTIYRWESEGNLPFPKLRIGPNKVGFRRSDVEAFLTNQTEKEVA